MEEVGEVDSSPPPWGSVIISEDEINVLLNTLSCIHTHTHRITGNI